MEIEELKKLHPLNKAHAREWILLNASYSGIDKLIGEKYFQPHPREHQDNFARRIEKAFGFNFSATVIDLLSFYLFAPGGNFDYGSLTDSLLFQLFLRDADYEGRSFDEWLVLVQKKSAIYGQVGVFVDRPAVGPGRTDAQDIRDRVYANVSYYAPNNILDWTFGMSEFGRPELTFLKLFDDDEKFRLWTKDDWQIWKIVDGVPQLQASDINPLGIIPFFWQINEDIGEKVLGRSDICEIWKIDASIIENAMQAEEIIDLDAFPQLLLPDNIEAPGEPEIIRSVSGVLPFDPTLANGKPDWLRQEASDSITCIMEWINEKVRNIYRASNLSGVTTNFSSQARSGESLKREFQLLNAKLRSKSVNIENAQKRIVALWALWQNQDDSEVVIQRSTEFDVEALSDQLDNILTASSYIRSDLFRRTMEKRVSRQVIGIGDEQTIIDIDGEIDNEQTTEEVDSQ